MRSPGGWAGGHTARAHPQAFRVTRGLVTPPRPGSSPHAHSVGPLEGPPRGLHRLQAAAARCREGSGLRAGTVRTRQDHPSRRLALQGNEAAWLT